MLEAENFKLYCNQTLTGKLSRKEKKKKKKKKRGSLP